MASSQSHSKLTLTLRLTQTPPLTSPSPPLLLLLPLVLLPRMTRMTMRMVTHSLGDSTCHWCKNRTFSVDSPIFSHRPFLTLSLFSPNPPPSPAAALPIPSSARSALFHVGSVDDKRCGVYMARRPAGSRSLFRANTAPHGSLAATKQVTKSIPPLLPPPPPLLVDCTRSGLDLGWF